MLCSGRYTKATNKAKYKDKTRVPKDAQENEAGKSEGPTYKSRWTKRSQNVEQMKDLSNVRKSPSCNTVDDASTSSGIKSPSCNTHRSQRHVTKKQRKAITLKTEGDVLTVNVPKRPRTPGLREEHKFNYSEKENLPKRKKKITKAGPWFAFYADEESDKDIKPLVNNRTERRKKEKLSKLKGRFPDAEAVDVACSSQHCESSKLGTALVERKKAHDPPPFEDKIIYILDD